MLMQAAGPQGPLPATDAVIEGLPRFKLDAPGIGELDRLSSNEARVQLTLRNVEKSPFKDCPVCKDDFVPDDEVMRVPCKCAPLSLAPSP